MPLDWLIDPLALRFQQRALLGGIVAGLMSSVVGTWADLIAQAIFAVVPVVFFFLTLSVTLVSRRIHRPACPSPCARRWRWPAT